MIPMGGVLPGEHWSSPRRVVEFSPAIIEVENRRAAVTKDGRAADRLPRPHMVEGEDAARTAPPLSIALLGTRRCMEACVCAGLAARSRGVAPRLESRVLSPRLVATAKIGCCVV
ncbi:hypothetical protein Dimus_015916 [Dionaea muscipula]